MSQSGSRHEDEDMEGESSGPEVEAKYKAYSMNTMLLVKSS